MDYKYKELDYARKIYEDGFQSEQHRPTELRLAATYMRRVLNYKPKKLREELYQWCESHIPGYKKELYYKMINTAFVRACKKGSMLIQLEKIDFYQYEMDYITDLFITNDGGRKESEYSYACKKLLFTLLFQMKANQSIAEAKSEDEDFAYKGMYFRGGQKKYTELKRLARLPEKVRIHEDIINILWINGLVSPMFNGLVKLNFMEAISQMRHGGQKSDTSVALQVKDYEAVGWYFDYYNQDKKIAFCKKCGKIFRKSSNRQEYCSDECSKTVDRAKAKERMKTIRKT